MSDMPKDEKDEVEGHHFKGNVNEEPVEETEDDEVEAHKMANKAYKPAAS